MLYQRLRCRLNAGIDGLLAGPSWKLKALAAIAVISLFRAFPNYDVLGTLFFETTWHDVQLKFDHPMLDTSRIFAPGSHQSNLTFRLTVPLLAHVLHLHEAGVLIFSALAGFVLWYLVLKVAFTLSSSKRVALFVCLTTACTWPGTAAFHELRGGYYDALALCLLLAAMASSSSLLATLLLFLAAWTDERALVASSFVFLLYLFSNTGGIRRHIVAKPAAVVAAAAGYLGIRAYLTAAHPYAFSISGVGISVLRQQTNVVPLAIWSGLGGSWILVIFCLLTLFRQKRYLAAAVFGAVLIVMIGVSLAAVDVTRGMAYCLPAVFVALAVLGSSERTKQLDRLAAICAVISFLVPTFYLEGGSGLFWLYPLPMQIVRWMRAGLLPGF